MKALSLDLRERILSTYDKEKGTREQGAQRFRVSLPAIGFPHAAIELFKTLTSVRLREGIV
jgi:hypothetical protein